MMHRKSSSTETILGILTGLLILFLITKANWLLYAAIGLGLTGLFWKSGAAWIERGWMWVARALGYINSRIILGLIFFVLLFPIAFFYRLSKKDPLQLRGKKKSYFTERNHLFTRKDMENPW